MPQRIWGLRLEVLTMVQLWISRIWRCVRTKSDSSILKAVHSSHISPDLLNLGDESITFLEKVRIPLSCDTVSCSGEWCPQHGEYPKISGSHSSVAEDSSSGMWCHIKWVRLNMFKALSPVEHWEPLTQWQSIKYQATWHLPNVPQLTLRYDSLIRYMFRC
jgi:hypothetical protein